MMIKMPTSDVAADRCSSDSLSFTGLVCSQDQLSKAQSHEPKKYHRRKATKVSENDINFEFSYSSQSPVGVKVHKKTESSDLFELKLNEEPRVHGHVTMKDVLEPKYKGWKPGSRKEIGNGTNGGFAKLMQSITTPCRSCSVVEPSAVNRASVAQGV